MSSELEGQSDITDEVEVEDDQREPELGAEVQTPPNWTVQIQKLERTIYELHRRYKKNELNLQPDFQRAFVWDEEKQVRLVESVLTKIPLPVIYLSEENETSSIVIDGQQRLTTLFHFLDNKFPLKRLSLLSRDLNDKTFSQLPPLLQRRFEDTPLTCFIVQPGSNSRFKFDLFERLNQGAAVLTPQEIRDALYRGECLAMILSFAEHNLVFRATVRKRRGLPRGKDRELILRCLALQFKGIDAYTGDLKNFLNDALQEMNQLSRVALQPLFDRLEQSLTAAQVVFGDKAFQKPGSSHLNAPLLEAITYGFVHFPQLAPWEPHAARLREGFMKLFESTAFVDAVVYSTGDRNKLQLRVGRWMDVLRTCLPADQPTEAQEAC